MQTRCISSSLDTGQKLFCRGLMCVAGAVPACPTTNAVNAVYLTLCYGSAANIGLLKQECSGLSCWNSWEAFILLSCPTDADAKLASDLYALASDLCCPCEMMRIHVMHLSVIVARLVFTSRRSCEASEYHFLVFVGLRHQQLPGLLALAVPDLPHGSYVYLLLEMLHLTRWLLACLDLPGGFHSGLEFYLDDGPALLFLPVCHPFCILMGRPKSVLPLCCFGAVEAEAEQLYMHSDASDELLSCLLLMLVPAEYADVFSCLLDILYPFCLGCMDGGRLFDDEAG
ncbi:hypothetical protein Nepgr_017367 [Nepenthes gracilis]|uniref:Uncharacterized protein n=1 Tax=Nepenthes gracilis TaxID=150966 RepID=A0AAD3XTA6_NEPGR|nr:hypothetical protein Nepgr_017367 [Nepenthes gracilis]